MGRENRRVRQRKKREALAREADAEVRRRRDEQMALYGDNPGPPDEAVADDDGVTGSLLASRRFLKSDARMAARLISLGVIEEDQCKAILRKCFTMAAKTEKPREYSSLMATATAAARLELDHLKLAQASLMIEPVRDEITLDAASISKSRPVG